MSKKAAKRLEKLGVKVLTGTKVEKVDEKGVVAGRKEDSERDGLVDGGRRGFADREDARRPDRSGRQTAGRSVLEWCRASAACSPSAMWLRSSQDGRPVPGVAQVAIQQGRYVGPADLHDSSRAEAPRRPFRYFDKGNMAVVGKNFAVLERGRIRMSGFVTWLVWVFIHVMFLPQLQNRLRVQRQWFWSYWTGQRSSRLISEARRGPVNRPDRRLACRLSLIVPAAEWRRSC